MFQAIIMLKTIFSNQNFHRIFIETLVLLNGIPLTEFCTLMTKIEAIVEIQPV